MTRVVVLPDAGPPSSALDREGHVGVCPLPGLRADGGPMSGHVLPGCGQVAGGAGQHGWQRHQTSHKILTENSSHVDSIPVTILHPSSKMEVQ